MYIVHITLNMTIVLTLYIGIWENPRIPRIHNPDTIPYPYKANENQYVKQGLHVLPHGASLPLSSVNWLLSLHDITVW